MKIHKVSIATFLVFLAVAGGGSLLYTVYRLRNHPEYLSDTAAQIQRIEKAQGQTITLTETKAGQRKWVLKMKEIKYSKDNSIAELIGVEGLLYGDKQDVMFTFQAPTGEYYKENNRVILHKGVTMVSPSAKVMLKAPDMDWSSNSDVITATGGVQMQKEGFGTSQAQKAVFAMDFSKIEFSGGALSNIGVH